MRGCGDSTGEIQDEYAPQEQQDACRVIEWIARQPWCTGSVGMMGISWGGFNSLQVAFEQPEALKAIIPICFTDDRYSDDVHFKGGAILLEKLRWAATMEAKSMLPPDIELSPDWLAKWLERLKTLPSLAKNWLSHQTRDEYWKHGSVCEDYSKIKAAAFLWGGYADGYTNSVRRTLDNIGCAKRAVIGPWVHLYPHIAMPGPRWGFCEEAVKWWDKHLKANKVADEPELVCFIQDSVPLPFPDSVKGRWVAEPKTYTETLYLTGSSLSSTPGKGKVSFSTDETCGKGFNRYFPGNLKEVSADQSEDDKLSCTFETSGVVTPYEIFGRPVVCLSVASDKPIANIILRLCIIDPEGKSRLVSYGACNLNHDDTHEKVTPLISGEFKDIRIELDIMGERLAKNYKLRLCASTAYFPLFLPNPERVTLTLDLSKCQLEIPILKSWSELPHSVPEPSDHKPLPTTVNEISEMEKTSETDESGRFTSTISSRIKNRLEKIGLTTEWITTDSQSIHPDDPQTAELNIKHNMIWSKENWETWMTYEMKFSCDRENLYVKERKVAKHNGEVIFEKTDATTVVRHGN